MGSDETNAATARRNASREQAPLAPSWVVEYTVPANQPSIASVSRSGEMVELRFTVPATYCYEVQFADALTRATWTALTNVCAPVQDLNALVLDPIASAQRFYRLHLSGQVR